MSSITKLLSENIIMSPPNNNNNRNTIYRGSVFSSFVTTPIIDSAVDNEEESNNKKRVFELENTLTSHLLSRNLHEDVLYCNSRRNFSVLHASENIFDTFQQRASVEVYKNAGTFVEMPNKPHDWPPFIFKNDRQSDVFHKRYFDNRDLNLNFDSSLFDRLRNLQEESGNKLRADIDANKNDGSVAPINVPIETTNTTNTDTNISNDTSTNNDNTAATSTDKDIDDDNIINNHNPTTYVFDTKLDYVMETLLSIKIDQD